MSAGAVVTESTKCRSEILKKIPEYSRKENLNLPCTGNHLNFIGTLLFGVIIGAAVPALREAAVNACSARLAQLPFQTVLRGFLCGILMYVAVWVFSRKKTVLGIIFCIPVFVLSGFEHSIADMFYFSLAGSIFRPQSLLFLLLVVLGNSAGGLFIPLLSLLKGKDSNE